MYVYSYIQYLFVGKLVRKCKGRKTKHCWQTSSPLHSEISVCVCVRRHTFVIWVFNYKISFSVLTNSFSTATPLVCHDAEWWVSNELLWLKKGFQISRRMSECGFCMALLFGRHSTGTLFVNSNQLLADVVGVGRLCISRDFFILRNMVGFSRQFLSTHWRHSLLS